MELRISQLPYSLPKVTWYNMAMSMERVKSLGREIGKSAIYFAGMAGAVGAPMSYDHLESDYEIVGNNMTLFFQDEIQKPDQMQPTDVRLTPDHLTKLQQVREDLFFQTIPIQGEFLTPGQEISLDAAYEASRRRDQMVPIFYLSTAALVASFITASLDLGREMKEKPGRGALSLLSMPPKKD